MRNYLRKYPLHSFLISSYFICFIYVQNIRSVALPMAYRSVLVSILVSALCFLVVYLVFRSFRKAGIFTTSIIVGFFAYGTIYNWLEGLYWKGAWPFSHIHRYQVIFYLAIFPFLFTVLWRSRRPHYFLNYLLNIFVITLLSINIFVGVVAARKKAPYTETSTRPVETKVSKGGPDIYYIILDGFASESTLRKFYNDPAPFFYTFLRNRGFYIADSSRTNYPATAQSLGSSMNLNYLDSLSEQAELVRENQVSKEMKKLGYRVVDIESGYAVTENLAYSDQTIPVNGLNEFESRLLELTILRLDDIVGYFTYSRLNSQLERLPLIAKEPGPKFAFIHIVAPHPPYVVNEGGRQVVPTSISDHSWEPREAYLAQLKFVSRKVMELIDTVLSRRGPKPVIIVQSDHGPWIADAAENVYEARVGILNSFYGPDTLMRALYPTITPVNAFRVTLKSIHGMNFPLLPDKPLTYESLLENSTFRKYAIK